MKTSRAFSPTHITGFFQIFDRTTNVLQMGSKGAGISLSSGVITRVRVERSSAPSLKISINGVRTKSAIVSKQVVKLLLSSAEARKNRITVDHYIDVPTGRGFGSSGAGALSLALALNDALNLNLTRSEVAQIAHVAEIECKTGLGTVIAEALGGLEIRLKPGAPGVGEIRKIPIRKDNAVLCVYSKPISTKEILTNPVHRRRINEIGGKLVNQLAAHPSPAKFMTLSRNFAEHLGLVSTKMRKILSETDKAGLTFSMAMFGEAIFGIVESNRIGEIKKMLSTHLNLRVKMFTTTIDREGAKLL